MDDPGQQHHLVGTDELQMPQNPPSRQLRGLTSISQQHGIAQSALHQLQLDSGLPSSGSLAQLPDVTPELLVKFAGLPTPQQLASSLLYVNHDHHQHQQQQQHKLRHQQKCHHVEHLASQHSLKHVDGPAAGCGDPSVRQHSASTVPHAIQAHLPLLGQTGLSAVSANPAPALPAALSLPVDASPLTAAAPAQPGRQNIMPLPSGAAEPVAALSLPPHVASNVLLMRKLRQLQLAQSATPSKPADGSTCTTTNNPGSLPGLQHELEQRLIMLKALTVCRLQDDIRAQLLQELPQAQAAASPAGSRLAVIPSSATHSNLQGLRSPIVRMLPQLQQQQQQVCHFQTQAAAVRQSRCQAVIDWHKEEAAAHQRRREEAAAARLAALKTAGLPAYLALLQQSKNGRLQQVLMQTDDVLKQLAARLAVVPDEGDVTATVGTASTDSQQQPEQQQEGLPAAPGGPGSCAGGGGVLDSSIAWSRLSAAIPASIPEQPAMLKGGELREYQLQGLCWLVGLAQKGLNGILADDMGLGKTVQVIAFVCHCVEVLKVGQPFLIICPASVMSNWADELSRWAPGLKVVLYKGSAEARNDIYMKQVSGRSKQQFHVLLTTYELLMGAADRPRLSKIHWQALVVDEGHRLKNADCKLSQELRMFRSKNRLLLTGTPLQNKLGELWSLLNFLMPDVFSSRDDFDEWFGTPMQAIREAGSSAAASAAGSATEASMLSQEEYLLLTTRLHQVLRPFMMRRLKEAVAMELPQKTEVVLRCQLSPYQAALYDLVKTKLRDQAAAGTGGSSSGSSGAAVSVKGVNNTVMELRNICNHPLLSKLHPEYGEDLLKEPAAPGSTGGCSSNSSGGGAALPPTVLRLSCKVDLLDQVLVRLAAGGHKVLLFCTMTRLLDLLEEYMAWRGWSFLRLDGATTAAERAAAVARFNDPGSGVFIFMLSLRAGGVGLNLQAADTVIMYDSDWNPQIDLQAQARAHRIGQRRDVLVVRLVAADTIEEHILQVAEQKRKFADSSITGGFFDGQTSHEQRRQYLLSILDSSNTPHGSGSSAAAAGTITAARLNTLIARGEQEMEMLQERDKLLAAPQLQRTVNQPGSSNGSNSKVTEKVAAGVTHSTEDGDEKTQDEEQYPWHKPLCRVATAEESADLIAAAREASAPRPQEDLSGYGRGMRGVAVANRTKTAMPAEAVAAATTATTTTSKPQAGTTARAAAAAATNYVGATVPTLAAAAASKTQAAATAPALVATAAAKAQSGAATPAGAAAPQKVANPGQATVHAKARQRPVAAAAAAVAAAGPAGCAEATKAAIARTAVQANATADVAGAGASVSAKVDETDTQTAAQLEEAVVTADMVDEAATVIAAAADAAVDARSAPVAASAGAPTPPAVASTPAAPAAAVVASDAGGKANRGIVRPAASDAPTAPAQKPATLAQAAILASAPTESCKPVTSSQIHARGNNSRSTECSNSSHRGDCHSSAVVHEQDAAGKDEMTHEQVEGAVGQHDKQELVPSTAVAATCSQQELSKAAIEKSGHQAARCSAGHVGRVSRAKVQTRQALVGHMQLLRPHATGDQTQQARQASESCGVRQKQQLQQQMAMHDSSSQAPGLDILAEAAAAETVGKGSAAVKADAGSATSSSHQVLVVCGSIKGLYCLVKDEVLLQQHLSPAESGARSSSSSSSSNVGHCWLSKTAFMKLAGEGFQKMDASKSIKLQNADGSAGLALYTHIKHNKQGQRQLQAQLARLEQQEQHAEQRGPQQHQTVLADITNQAQSNGLATAGSKKRSRHQLGEAEQQLEQQPAGPHKRQTRQVQQQAASPGPSGSPGLDVLAQAAASAEAASPGPFEDCCTANPFPSAAATSSSNSSSVPVLCGSLEGCYCLERGEVLLQHMQPVSQQQQPGGAAAAATVAALQPAAGSSIDAQVWVGRTAFVKMAGQQHCHDAYKAIKVRSEDGSASMTLATYLKRRQQGQNAPLQAEKPAAPEQAMLQMHEAQRWSSSTGATSRGGSGRSGPLHDNMATAAKQKVKRVRFQLDYSSMLDDVFPATGGGGSAKRPCTSGPASTVAGSAPTDQLLAAHNALFSPAWDLPAERSTLAPVLLMKINSAHHGQQQSTARSHIAAGAAPHFMQLVDYLWHNAD